MAPMQRERCRFSLNVVLGCLYAIGGASEMDEETADDEVKNCVMGYSTSIIFGGWFLYIKLDIKCFVILVRLY